MLSIKKKVFPRKLTNIYERHLQNFIDYHIAPYDSLKGLELKNISTEKWLSIILMNALMEVNLLRFMLIVVFGSRGETNENLNFFQSLLCQYFPGNRNSLLFHFVVVATFATPAVFCRATVTLFLKYVLISYCTICFDICACRLFRSTNPTYVGVTVLLSIVKEGNFEAPRHFFDRLRWYMHFLELFRLFLVVSVTSPTIFLVLLDLAFNYSCESLILHRPLELLLIAFWDYLYIASQVQILQLTGILFGHVFFVIYYFKVRFVCLQQRLKKCFYKRKIRKKQKESRNKTFD